MAITMQGSWTIRVASKNAAFAQHFVVTGADVGNGTYDGVVGTAVFASGAQWSINIQNQAPAQPWRDSAQRITFPTVSGGLVRFDIDSNDSGPDADYDDLVLTCSMPATASDYLVYGTVKTYSGRCLFNPCRDDYVVIDPPFSVLNLCTRFPELCGPLTRLYPERIVKPRPLPDPPPDVRPLVIPTGAPSLRTGVVFQSRLGSMPMGAVPRAEAKGARKGTEAASFERFEAEAVERLQTSARMVTFNAAPARAGADLLTAADFRAIAAIRDGILRFHCDSAVAPGLLLRFQEYDRTASERLGGPYTGTGARDDLGLAVTDEQGNYIFRFSQTLSDIAAETSDVAAGEVLATQLRPDVIAQVLGTGMTMTYETAPYYNIANVQRIDLCVPYENAHPSRACSGDRVIQRVGDIIVLHSALSGHPNTLDSQGRITSRNANAPQVDCAGWRGGLRLYCCFGKPQAVHYAIYFKRPSETQWRPVNQSHALNYIPAFAPGYTGTPVGSTLRSVIPSVPLVGGPGQPVPTYDNHDGDLNWIENDLKMILDSGIYRPWDQPGSVQFHIEAYDTAGNMVAATGDTITLYIHNRTAIAGRPNNSKGDIASITMGTTTLGDCGLFELTDPRAALTVRYRAVDPEGFLHSWTLSVKRGNNVDVPVAVASGVGTADASGVVRKGYNPMSPCNFTGTRDEPTADIDDYVLTGLQPAGTANWLPAGHNFCAFGFTLEAYDRVTDGRTANPRVVFWQDLIGLSTGP